MKQRRRNQGMTVVLAAAVALAAGCVGDSGAAGFECSFGDLAGTWRLSYVETDGNCGPIADETTSFNPGTPGEFEGCTVYSQSISTDRCRAEEDIECPLADGQGAQRWTSVFDHVGEGFVTGTATAQVSHPELGTCRSTYDIDAMRL